MTYHVIGSTPAPDQRGRPRNSHPVTRGDSEPIGDPDLDWTLHPRLASQPVPRGAMLVTKHHLLCSLTLAEVVGTGNDLDPTRTARTAAPTEVIDLDIHPRSGLKQCHSRLDEGLYLSALIDSASWTWRVE